MTYRGTVINGVIVPDAGQSLPEGTRVRMNPVADKQRDRSRRRLKAPIAVGRPKSPPKDHPHPLTALAGIWKDRPDWKGKSSTEVVAELRRRPRSRRV